MRVAIVTMVGNNYGNRLQNYALQEMLRFKGHEVKTVALPEGERIHHSERFVDVLGKLTPSHMRQVASSRFKNRYPYKNQRDGVLRSIRLSKTEIPGELAELREEAFELFDRSCVGMGSMDDEFDAFVCGSDQIWNPTYSTTGANAFLRHIPEHKRIAFAPSFGLSELPPDLVPLYRKWLLGIPHLSVREESGACIIHDLTGRDVPVLPDPTLCLNRQQWEAMERRPSFDDGAPFILTYFLGNETNKYRRFIEFQAAGARIINLYDMREPEHYTANPAEFVWLVHHARAMFTDSFHGTVFSLIFHTPFVVFDRVESGGTAMGSRIDTLLQTVGLDNRRFGDVSSVWDIDFARADEAIAQWVYEARLFIKTSLGEVVDTVSSEQHSSYVLERKEDCSGCGACAVACPRGCITMEADEEGFRYPKIDARACVHCNACRKICANSAATLADGEERIEHAYVAASNDKESRRQSSSGGLFTELAKETLRVGGTVYGAGFDDCFKVVHKSACSRVGLAELRGSKYVQSEAEECYGKIHEILEQGESVYFSGTPCQVDGLLAFLDKDFPNLLTQDIICHGVPSPVVWREYLALRSKGHKVRDVSFRDKSYGWHYFSIRIATDYGTYLARLGEDIYTRLFLSNVTLRPSCYACRHKHLHRKADLTLGDCWGVGKLCHGVPDTDEGLSLVFANTEKGQDFLRRRNAESVEVSMKDAASSQMAMTQSVPRTPSRELFFAQSREWGMREALKEWFGWDAPTITRAKFGYRKYRIARALGRYKR